jgi:hypothetical protein
VVDFPIPIEPVNPRTIIRLSPFVSLGSDRKQPLAAQKV